MRTPVLLLDSVNTSLYCCTKFSIRSRSVLVNVAHSDIAASWLWRPGGVGGKDVGQHSRTGNKRAVNIVVPEMPYRLW